MKIRGTKSTEKIEPQMAPMIDVVFQLLIFFMLTLKIIEPEGDFTVNMPIGQSAAESDSPKPPVIKVRMKADPVTGEMYSMTIANKELFASAPGASQEEKSSNAFKRLNSEILNAIGSPGNPLADDQEVELDPDFALNSKYLINAIGACRGRVQRVNGQARMIDYIKNIKFASPREEGAGG
ncbi:MAG: biopolymer transporter ExbD [Planctomycetaceae bacterium]|jgi:biopolymer transport protein ExbD|nr:biopolymer transporter ExbD [Planctomycetaceae bacterium]